MIREITAEERAEDRVKLTVLPQSNTKSEVLPSPYSPTRTGQNMSSVLLILPSEHTWMRSPNSFRCVKMASVAARSEARESFGVAASSA